MGVAVCQLGCWVIAARARMPPLDFMPAVFSVFSSEGPISQEPRSCTVEGVSRWDGLGRLKDEGLLALVMTENGVRWQDAAQLSSSLP